MGAVGGRGALTRVSGYDINHSVCPAFVPPLCHMDMRRLSAASLQEFRGSSPMRLQGANKELRNVLTVHLGTNVQRDALNQIAFDEISNF